MLPLSPLLLSSQLAYIKTEHPWHVAFHLNSLFSAFVFLPYPNFSSPFLTAFVFVCFYVILSPFFMLHTPSGHAKQSTPPLYVPPVSFFPCLAGCDCRRRRRMSRTQVQLFPLSCMHLFVWVNVFLCSLHSLSLSIGTLCLLYFTCIFVLFLSWLIPIQLCSHPDVHNYYSLFPSILFVTELWATDPPGGGELHSLHQPAW